MRTRSVVRFVAAASLLAVVGACDQGDRQPASTSSVAIQPPSQTPSQTQPASSTTEPKVDPSLLLGKPPPPFKVAKWAKGTPVTELEKGKVYVVDFWATWCGPCKAAIPHLTKMAQAHKGKVEVIGVSISEKQDTPEDTKYIDAVQKFVDKMADRMDYRVAIDTPDKQMHSTWFKPTGTGGIPTAYIIDQQGNVAWTGIGTPAVIERIVGGLLAGTFDPKAEAEYQREQEADAEERAKKAAAEAKANSKNAYEKFPGYQDAMAKGETATALAILDNAFKEDPANETGGAYQWKIMLLLQRNKPEQVNEYAKYLLEKYPSNDDIIGFASAVLVGTSEETRFDNKLALTLAQKTDAAAKPDSRWAQFAKWRLGWAYFHTGDKQKAIEAMQTALDNVKRLKATIEFDDLEMQCEDALKVFQR